MVSGLAVDTQSASTPSPQKDPTASFRYSDQGPTSWKAPGAGRRSSHHGPALRGLWSWLGLLPLAKDVLERFASGRSDCVQACRLRVRIEERSL